MSAIFWSKPFKKWARTAFYNYRSLRITSCLFRLIWLMPSVLSRLLLAPDRLFSVPGSPAVPIVEPCSVISHPWCQTCLEANKTVIRTVLYKCFRTYFTLYLVYLLCTFCPISCFLIRPLKMGTTLSSDVFFFQVFFPSGITKKSSKSAEWYITLNSFQSWIKRKWKISNFFFTSFEKNRFQIFFRLREQVYL